MQKEQRRQREARRFGGRVTLQWGQMTPGQQQAALGRLRKLAGEAAAAKVAGQQPKKKRPMEKEEKIIPALSPRMNIASVIGSLKRSASSPLEAEKLRERMLSPLLPTRNRSLVVQQLLHSTSGSLAPHNSSVRRQVYIKALTRAKATAAEVLEAETHFVRRFFGPQRTTELDARRNLKEMGLLRTRKR